MSNVTPIASPTCINCKHAGAVTTDDDKRVLQCWFLPPTTAPLMIPGQAFGAMTLRPTVAAETTCGQHAAGVPHGMP